MASGLPSTASHKKLGGAPIASFEDLSEEVENGEPAARMPGIVEVTSPATPGSSLKTPSTPRIDISRASSSSQHEDSNSRDSSPERELFAGGEPPSGCKLTLGYKEDAQDLRSSTEELDLQDPIHEQDLRREAKKLARRRKEDGCSLSDYSGREQERERKDSSCSEIFLLNISGRTSRLSSVGSQGSGVSGKLSAASAASAASAVSAASATSSRSPSPYKCMLVTSFCGIKKTQSDNQIETLKPTTEDLEKMLVKDGADTTKALIPEGVKVPIVDGRIKPDPIDMPRIPGREERKENFRREVEITKKVLERVNINVPIILKPPEMQEPVLEQPKSQGLEVQKPATLDFNDRRKKTQDFKEIVETAPSSVGSPKLPRHQKVRDIDGSRTPSPSSVSRKNSFASLFKVRMDNGSQNQQSPSPSTKPRRSLTTKIKDTTESLRSRSKSRERGSIDKGSSLKKETKNKGVFSSTLSLFKRRERKKSYDEAIASTFDPNFPSVESIGPVKFTFNKDPKEEEAVFISLHGDERKHEEALPSESVSIPLETPTKLLDEYEAETTPSDGDITQVTQIELHPAPTSRIRMEVQIETHTSSKIPSRSSSHSVKSLTKETYTSSKIRTEAQIETTHTVGRRLSSTQPPHSASKDSHVSKSSSKDSKLSSHSAESKSTEHRMSSSSSKDSFKKPEAVKPERKCKDRQRTEPSEEQKRRGLIREPAVVHDALKVDASDDEKPKDGFSKVPSVISDLDHNSSESERDSEVEFIRSKAEKLAPELPDERKGLFYEESFEEDLPYVPTTLPMEKSMAVPILPVKQRHQEVRTIPIERPRSTTPINPTLLDEFVQQTAQDERRVEKIKISLPREESFKLKSPKKHGTNTFSEFAGKVVPDGGRKSIGKSPSPPPLPPRAPAKPSNWINFEEIPEKRKAPKRIQTIPRADEESKGAGSYSYVQPEECRCECHEESRRAMLREASVTTTTSSSCSSNGERACNGENCTVPTSGSMDRASIVSDSSLECSLSIEEGPQGAQALLGSMKPFSMDLDLRSNRSSIISQDETDETPHQ